MYFPFINEEVGKKIKKPRKLSDTQRIISKFVSSNLGYRDKSFWGREGKITKNLILEYGIDFFNWLDLPDNKQVGSMLWFVAPEGKVYLKIKFFDFKKTAENLFEKQQEIVLSEAKIGEDIKTVRNKPKSLKDFLNLYGKKN